jgi:two-component system sensor histidine kinase TctE
MSAPSLRNQLLRWLMVPLALLWAVDAILGWISTERAVDAAYDRSLYASALAIAEQISLGGGTVHVDLPSMALEVLETGGEQERVFYRVGLAGGPFLTGYDDLPGPGERPLPAFFFTWYRGNRVRIAAIERVLPAAEGPVRVRVQVAETLLNRSARVHDILGGTLVPQMLLILVAAAAVFFGVRRGLAPLAGLRRQISERSMRALDPVESGQAPVEVEPLVSALNQLMSRVKSGIEVQRRFIADASHQLRTPLAVLRAQADEALRQRDEEAIRAVVTRLAAQTRSTSRLVTQLLALAHAERSGDLPGWVDHVDLAAVGREVCASMAPGAIEQGVDLGFEGDEGPFVRGSPALLHELLVNVVDNAIRYAGAPSRVTITTKAVDGYGELAVEDDGPGIPVAERGRVLDRFYRSPGTPGDGSGLGLAIVAEIAQEHGARLELADGPSGKGLLVKVRFPRQA